LIWLFSNFLLFLSLWVIFLFLFTLFADIGVQEINEWERKQQYNKQYFSSKFPIFPLLFLLLMLSFHNLFNIIFWHDLFMSFASIGTLLKRRRHLWRILRAFLFWLTVIIGIDLTYTFVIVIRLEILCWSQMKLRVSDMMLILYSFVEDIIIREIWKFYANVVVILWDVLFSHVWCCMGNLFWHVMIVKAFFLPWLPGLKSNLSHF